MTDTNQPSSLEEATHLAVEESRKVVAVIQEAASEVTAEMERLAESLKCSQDESDLLFASVLAQRAADIEALFRKQAAASESFNIVLFGRTGAGKSSLIEALTRGNGSSVSRGESDWTTEVAPKSWKSCRIYDTPGINGWGRQNTREDLESRARDAAEVADFILLCFDSQSQQASEFEKVSAWIETFNKPAIAVLNVRNAVWRLPARVPVGAARANLSRTVAEHAGNITAELGSIGMQATPVVAMATKRALFARCTLPFQGPDNETLLAYRKKHGAVQLEHWSNFAALETLLVRCIQDHAVALRTGALNDQLRGVLDALVTDANAAAESATHDAEIIENQTITRLLSLLGYPVSEVQRSPYFRDGVDLLTGLEGFRGKFQSSSIGEFEVFIHDTLKTKIGSLRSKSLAAGEELVTFAFDKGAQLPGEELRAVCFPLKDMEEAAMQVMNEASDFLDRRACLAYRDAIADLTAEIAEMAGIRGGAGKGRKYAALSIKGGGLLLGALNIWNPLGWAAGVVFAGMGVASVVGWLGGNLRTSAESQKLIERRKALSELRRGIHQVFNSFTEKVAKETAKIASKAAGSAVLPAVEKAFQLRNRADVSRGLAKMALSLAERLPAKADPRRLLVSAKDSCERDANLSSPALSRRLWLGESWIDDPDGLQKPLEIGGAKRTVAYDPGLFESMFTGLRNVWRKVVTSVSPGSGRKWLASVREALCADPLAMPKLDELQAIADKGRPRLQLIGDYNAGKSSFIKRLLLDAGYSMPPDLHIRADPTTDRERIYEWNRVDLVDTPGFQSSNLEHTEAALRSIPDASAVIFLFQPNLMIGDDRFLRGVLQGERELGQVPKLSRTFFVINRSDELGIDPDDNLPRFKELADLKRRELSEALASRGFKVPQSQILCMASDPYGLVGNRDDANSASYDSCRAFDGFKQFMESFREVEGDLRRNGLDRSILEGGIARLHNLDLLQAKELEKLSSQKEVLLGLLALIKERMAEGCMLSKSYRAKLTRLLQDSGASLRDEVLSETDPVMLRLKAENIDEWWKEDALAVELEHWQKSAIKDLDLWRSRAEESIQRRLDSREFMRIFGDPQLEAAPLPPGTSIGKSGLGHSVETGGRMLGNTTRDTVYAIGKGLGFKFKPWGATKLALKLGKVGGAIAIVGVVWNAVDIVLVEVVNERRDEARKEISDWISNTIPLITAAIADGDDEEPGLLRCAEESIQNMGDGIIHLQNRLRFIEDEIRSVGQKRLIYDSFVTGAEELLGRKVWNDAPESFSLESEHSNSL